MDVEPTKDGVTHIKYTSDTDRVLIYNIQIRSGNPVAAQNEEEEDFNVDCTGFPPIQLLTNAECSINPACSRFSLVFRLRKNSLRKKNKEICWGRQDMAGRGESGNIDCKPACQGAIDLDQQYALHSPR